MSPVIMITKTFWLYIWIGALLQSSAPKNVHKWHKEMTASNASPAEERICSINSIDFSVLAIFAMRCDAYSSAALVIITVIDLSATNRADIYFL